MTTFRIDNDVLLLLAGAAMFLPALFFYLGTAASEGSSGRIGVEAQILFAILGGLGALVMAAAVFILALQGAGVH